ncbi:hypothetical protein BDA96_02G060800 [Sorghum bicolor]|uniref:F-box domain-containing protein n=1 Tax=Sorghum bicolor TaxID=4558 RepID=A0A921RLJ5_SORBI|nr:hypothetical protein BDA96_02G060800 [Sorghum bicolor]
MARRRNHGAADRAMRARGRGKKETTGGGGDSRMRGRGHLRRPASLALGGMDCPKRMCDAEAAVAVLPDDPLVEILSRVPVKSVYRFKCVSKAFCHLIADPLHHKKLPQTLEGFFFRDKGHLHYNSCDISESYIVCNPATKQCVAVPNSGLTREHMMFGGFAFTYLLFDPGVCCHFNLVQFFMEEYKTSVHVYSSKTQAWSHNKSDWGGYHIAPNSPGLYFNGMLHLLSYLGRGELTVVDVEGNIQKIIAAPCQDYDRQQWVLKDSVRLSELFGERNHHMDTNYNHWDLKLILYNMDSKEVRDLCTLGHDYMCIAPYVPYFSEFGA